MWLEAEVLVESLALEVPEVEPEVTLVWVVESLALEADPLLLEVRELAPEAEVLEPETELVVSELDTAVLVVPSLPLEVD